MEEPNAQSGLRNGNDKQTIMLSQIWTESLSQIIKEEVERVTSQSFEKLAQVIPFLNHTNNQQLQDAPNANNVTSKHKCKNRTKVERDQPNRGRRSLSGHKSSKSRSRTRSNSPHESSRRHKVKDRSRRGSYERDDGLAEERHSSKRTNRSRSHRGELSRKGQRTLTRSHSRSRSYSPDNKHQRSRIEVKSRVKRNRQYSPSPSRYKDHYKDSGESSKVARKEYKRSLSNEQTEDYYAKEDQNRQKLLDNPLSLQNASETIDDKFPNQFLNLPRTNSTNLLEGEPVSTLLQNLMTTNLGGTNMPEYAQNKNAHVNISERARQFLSDTKLNNSEKRNPRNVPKSCQVNKSNKRNRNDPEMKMLEARKNYAVQVESDGNYDFVLDILSHYNSVTTDSRETPSVRSDRSSLTEISNTTDEHLLPENNYTEVKANESVTDILEEDWKYVFKETLPRNVKQVSFVKTSKLSTDPIETTRRPDLKNNEFKIGASKENDNKQLSEKHENTEKLLDEIGIQKFDTHHLKNTNMVDKAISVGNTGANFNLESINNKSIGKSNNLEHLNMESDKNVGPIQQSELTNANAPTQNVIECSNMVETSLPQYGGSRSQNKKANSIGKSRNKDANQRINIERVEVFDVNNEFVTSADPKDNIVNEQSAETLAIIGMEKGCEVIPTFDPGCDKNIEKWIENIDDCGKRYNWTEEYRINIMQAKLVGSARTWLDQLIHVNIRSMSWWQWKFSASGAFGDKRNFAKMVRKMMGRRKLLMETITMYYNAKLALCARCRITDWKDATALIASGLTKRQQNDATLIEWSNPEDMFVNFFSSCENDTCAFCGENWHLPSTCHNAKLQTDSVR